MTSLDAQIAVTGGSRAVMLVGPARVVAFDDEADRSAGPGSSDYDEPPLPLEADRPVRLPRTPRRWDAANDRRLGKLLGIHENCSLELGAGSGEDERKDET